MFDFWPIFKRETKVYYTSPIAYTISFIFLTIAGYFYFSNVVSYSQFSMNAAGNPYLTGLNTIDLILVPWFGPLELVILLMLPLLTMRLFSEEKKSGAFELLFSYPVQDLAVLLGKYLAGLFVFVLMVVPTALYFLILQGDGLFEPGVLFSGYLGLLLSGAAFIAFGIFISSLTENQIVAALITFGGLFMFWIVGWSARLADPPMNHVLGYLSLLNHSSDFYRGVINTSDLAYYLCFIFLFLFLTLRSLDSKRWRG